jgi:hypothetical protein
VPLPALTRARSSNPSLLKSAIALDSVPDAKGIAIARV